MSRHRLATFATSAYRSPGDFIGLMRSDDDPWGIVDERIIRAELLHPNLRTNDGIDWQSAMGGGPVEATSQLTGTATATSATSLTATGTPFSTSGGYGNSSASPLAGKIVVACSSGVWGVILSHTNAVLTIDKWYNPASPGGAAASTPSGTTVYTILTAVAPTWWMALTTDAGAPAATDHTLASELTTNGFARAVGGWTHSNGTNTFTLNNLFTSTGGDTTVSKEAIFNAQNGGIMTFESAEPSPPRLLSGDTLSQSVVVTY